MHPDDPYSPYDDFNHLPVYDQDLNPSSSAPLTFSSWSAVPGAHPPDPPKTDSKVYRLLFDWSPQRIAPVPSGSDVKLEEHVVKQEPFDDTPFFAHEQQQQQALKPEYDYDPFAYPFTGDATLTEPFPFEDYFDPIPVSAVSDSGSAFADYAAYADFGASPAPIASGSGYDPHVAYPTADATAAAPLPAPSFAPVGVGARLPPPPIPHYYNNAPPPYAPVQAPAASSSHVPTPAPARPVEAHAIVQRLAGCLPQLDALPDPYDDNGDFYGRGRDLFTGPRAKSDDIDAFLAAACNAEQFDGNASVAEGLGKLGLTAQRQLLPGMEVALMPHQTIGVAWMLDKEKDRTFNGGCLSDEMGLGKTIQMIAVMVTNASKDPSCKTNLILAPMALLDQWKLEIDLKTNLGLTCHIYHGVGKLKKTEDVLKYDVILTTYQTMALEWPDYEAEERARAKAQRQMGDDFNEVDYEEERRRRGRNKGSGLLFEIEWFRVVLDEAQNIRNRKTRNSRAVTQLKAKYRWCLTGTPITNGLSDTYPLLRFLKVRPWYDWMQFNSHVSRHERKNPQLAVMRLQAILAACNLRRMKTTKLDGKSLIELPSKDVHLLELEFTPEEREIYDMVERRSRETFNRFRRAGTVLKNYHHVLVMLLRLRQICCHAALIQEDDLLPGGVLLQGQDKIEVELQRARRLVSQQFIDKMKEKFMQSALARIVAEKESEDATVDEAGDDECPICFDVFTDAVVTPCSHCFCQECLMNFINGPHYEDGNEPPCPVCRAPVTPYKWFLRSAFEPTEAELAALANRAEGQSEDVVMADVQETDEEMSDLMGSMKSAKANEMQKSAPVFESNESDSMLDSAAQSDQEEEDDERRKATEKRLGKRKAVVISDDDDEEDQTCNIIRGKKSAANVAAEQVKLSSKFLPSTKMKFMMESIQKWAVENPDEKVLVVSQWTQCLDLVSAYLSEQGVLHVHYTGKMNRKMRDQAIRAFMTKEKVSVMLMSLKCGGVGLNLTRANRVISLDLGWSPAVENQAFDRVHRLGQQRAVTVQRLVIANTVEGRILKLQDRKQNLADGSLGEGKTKKIGRLSVRELAALFGVGRLR